MKFILIVVSFLLNNNKTNKMKINTPKYIEQIIENAINNKFPIKLITKEEWNSNHLTTDEIKVVEDYIQIYLSDYSAKDCFENNCLEKAPNVIPKSMIQKNIFIYFKNNTILLIL